MVKKGHDIVVVVFVVIFVVSFALSLSFLAGMNFQQNYVISGNVFVIWKIIWVCHKYMGKLCTYTYFVMLSSKNLQIQAHYFGIPNSFQNIFSCDSCCTYVGYLFFLFKILFRVLSGDDSFLVYDNYKK